METSSSIYSPPYTCFLSGSRLLSRVTSSKSSHHGWLLKCGLSRLAFALSRVNWIIFLYCMIVLVLFNKMWSESLQDLLSVDSLWTFPENVSLQLSTLVFITVFRVWWLMMCLGLAFVWSLYFSFVCFSGLYRQRENFTTLTEFTEFSCTSMRFLFHVSHTFLLSMYTFRIAMPFSALHLWSLHMFTLTSGNDSCLKNTMQ